MGAPDLLRALQGMGLRLSAHGSDLHVGPRTAITDEARRLIRDHKSELLAALRQSRDLDTPGRTTEVGPMRDRPRPTDADARRDWRRDRVLAMLAEGPEAQRVVYSDGQSVNGVVTICVAVRCAERIETVEIEVQADRYDGMALLDLVQRYGATVH